MQIIFIKILKNLFNFYYGVVMNSIKSISRYTFHTLQHLLSSCSHSGMGKKKLRFYQPKKFERKRSEENKCQSLVVSVPPASSKATAYSFVIQWEGIVEAHLRDLVLHQMRTRLSSRDNVIVHTLTSNLGSKTIIYFNLFPFFLLLFYFYKSDFNKILMLLHCQWQRIL